MIMKRLIKALSLLLAVVLLTGCGGPAESALQPSDMETYSFSVDRERVDSIRLIQDRETQKVWTTDDPEQIDTICDLFSGLNYGPRRYDAGYAGTYLRIEFMAGDALIRQIALANPDELQFLDEEPGFCVSILSGAWTEAEWESFLAGIPASPSGEASSDETLSGDSADAITAFENMKKYFHAGGNRWENMPDCFGGYDFNGTQNQTLTVLLTDMTEENMALFREACQTENIAFRQVEYSYLEVWTAYQDAQALMTAAYQERGTTVGYEALLETWENRVKLTVPVEQEQAGKTLAAEHPSIVLTVDAPILEPADHEDMIEDDSVVLTTTWPDYGSDTEWIYCLIENGAQETIYYGEDSFDLEVLQGDTWMRVPEHAGIGYNAVGICVGPETTGSYGVYLPIYNTELPAGQYRIAFHYDYRLSASLNHVACAEFTVTEHPERISFVPIQEQSTDADIAFAQGCVVAEQGTVRNQEALDRFARNTLRGAAEELRIVYPDIAAVAHITYHPRLNERLGYYELELWERDEKTVRRSVYSYLSVWDQYGSIILTPYGDLPWAEAQSLPVFADSFQMAPALGDAAEEIAAFDAARPGENSTVQALVMDAGDGDLWLVSLMQETYQEPLVYSIGSSLYLASGGGMGGMFEEYLETESHPVHIREAGENLVAVWFVTEDGTAEERLYRLTRTPMEYGEKIGMELVSDIDN